MIHSLFLSPGLNWLLNKALSQHVCIFTLHRPSGQHGLNGTDLTMLEDFLRLLIKHNCTFISVDELLDPQTRLNPAKNYICFTVDDGYEDQTDALLPVLLKYEAHPTLFVITDLIEGQLPWDARIATAVQSSQCKQLDVAALGMPGERVLSLKDKRQFRRQLSLHAKRLEKSARSKFVADIEAALCPAQQMDVSRYTPANWARLAELESQGLVIGSHTCAHNPLSTLTTSDIHLELNNSMALLNQHLSAPSKVFCYPVGMQEDYDERAMAVVREHGFIGALTSEPGYYVASKARSNAFAVPRLSLPATLNKATRYASWLEKLRATN